MQLDLLGLTSIHRWETCEVDTALDRQAGELKRLFHYKERDRCLRRSEAYSLRIPLRGSQTIWNSF